MGDHKINVASKGEKRAKFIEHLLADIAALELMLADDKIERSPIRIGSEQEFCLVDNDWTPSSKAVEILEKISDPHFTTELALYNLEINLDPIKLEGNCFTKMMDQQLELLEKARNVCEEYKTKIVLAGILPTISSRHIELEYMTPSPRYHVLNEMLRKLRGTDFSLHIMGSDEFTMKHESVLFEACNTSFQTHLQIDPVDFVASYNWSQAISGPLLSISTNSPLLLGKELWSETRIALFQQSIDTRISSYSIRQNEPRVTFGNDWIYNSITDIYKDDITRFQILISRDIEENSMELLKNDKTPKLEALSLHNGTIYRWNRPCYGVAKGIAHLRIENRYLPSGPTAIDEIASMVFWVGLMKGRPSKYDDITNKMNFKDAKSNFIKAARYGKQSTQNWMGKNYKPEQLTTEVLLPIARKGLQKINIPEEEINLYLGVIEDRIVNQDGAEWQVANYRNLTQHMNSDQALKMLSKVMHHYQQENLPVGQWKEVDPDMTLSDLARPEFVYEIMKTQLYTVSEEDSADLVSKMMDWKNINHVPVENDAKEIVGLLTKDIIQNHIKNNLETLTSVKDIMIKQVLTVKKNEHIDRVVDLMIRNGIGCVPVVNNKKLIGIVTKLDLPEA